MAIFPEWFLAVTSAMDATRLREYLEDDLAVEDMIDLLLHSVLTRRELVIAIDRAWDEIEATGPAAAEYAVAELKKRSDS